MSFWKKFGKIASVVAPIVAAPFTGGASLMLLGAGSGALGGALSGGGWKGALKGAAMGAIPGAVGKLGQIVGGAAKAGQVASAAKGAAPSAGFLSKALDIYGKAKPFVDAGGQAASIIAEPDEEQMPQYASPGPMQSRAWNQTQFNNQWMQPQNNAPRYSNWRNY